VTIALRPEDDAVVIAVSDTGIGIPAEEQERLFSRFFRSTLAVAEEIQGTGLGLTLVQSVVDRHGGTVEIDSVEGEGTTVTVRLPQAR
jgi:signal transduction histidine kinase